MDKLTYIKHRPRKYMNIENTRAKNIQFRRYQKHYDDRNYPKYYMIIFNDD